MPSNSNPNRTAPLLLHRYAAKGGGMTTDRRFKSRCFLGL